MKKFSVPKANRAFTLVELLVVIAVIAVLAAMIGFPPTSSHEKAKAVQCMSQLRQLAIGWMMWADDHTNQFPWQVSATNGGTLEVSSNGEAFPHFQVLSNYLKEFRVFICPTDITRHAATNYAEFSNQNLSYFINSSATLSNGPASVLSGDRHLQWNGKPVKPGTVVFTNGAEIGWTRELHGKGSRGPGGNLVFVDGHVEWNAKDPSAAFQRRGPTINQLTIP